MFPAVGHAMGLNHDGDASTPYFGGQARWAPIMGVGYYRPVTQWSKGEYANANNLEDDIAIIRNTLGASFPPSDGGKDLATAVPLSVSTRLSTGGRVTATAAGILESATAGDFYKFTTNAPGTLEIRVDVMPPLGAEGRANLDVTLTVFRVTTGELLVTKGKGMPSDPLGAQVTLPKALAGEYVVSVQPQGRGDPWSSGYSSYGSAGQYHIYATYADDGSTDLPVPSPPPPRRSPPPPFPPPPAPRPPPPPPPPPILDLPNTPPVPDSNGGGGRNLTGRAPMPPPSIVALAPPPAPLPVAFTTRAATLRLTAIRNQRWAWASAYIRVVDNLNRPVRGAKVTIRWHSPFLQQQQQQQQQQQGWPYTSNGTTGSTGVAFIFSKAVASQASLADASFYVVDIVADGLSWDGQPGQATRMRVSGNGGGSGSGAQQQNQQQGGSPPFKPGIDDYYVAPLLMP